MSQNEQKTYTPQDVINLVSQRKIDLYGAKENYDAAIKAYNDSVQLLMNAIPLMQAEINKHIQPPPAAKGMGATLPGPAMD